MRGRAVPRFPGLDIPDETGSGANRIGPLFIFERYEKWIANLCACIWDLMGNAGAVAVNVSRTVAQIIWTVTAVNGRKIVKYNGVTW